jgi:hypothetical protein
LLIKFPDPAAFSGIPGNPVESQIFVMADYGLSKTSRTFLADPYTANGFSMKFTPFSRTA